MAGKKGGIPAPTFALDPWLLVEDGFDTKALPVTETLTAQANGYIGTRGTYEEGTVTGLSSTEGTYLNGVYLRDPIHYDESAYGFATHNNKMILVPDAKSIRFEAEGEVLRQGSGQMQTQQRTLDMRDGLLTRRSIWRTKTGAIIEVKTRRMVCAEHTNLMVLEYEIQSKDFTGNITLETGLDADYGVAKGSGDPRAGALSIKNCLVDAECYRDGLGTVVTHRINGDDHVVLAAYRLEIERTRAKTITQVETSSFWGHRLSVDLMPDEKISLNKYIYYADGPHESRDTMRTAAEKKLDTTQKAGFDHLLQEQQAAFSVFWASADIQVNGALDVQQGMRFNLFNLFQSAGRDGKRALGAKGLSGPGYDGHYFWDTEIYAVPFFIFSQPRIARSLLSYRMNTLDAARTRAREMGHSSGALYPWRTISGEECSSFFPAGSAQYHINAAVAYALMQYIDATGDESVLYEGGAEMLFETARIWLQLGHFSPGHSGKFSIHEVTGPDEYSAMVDNNLYTNAMAQHHLERAETVALRLREQSPEYFNRLCEKLHLSMAEVANWRKAADLMYMPYDEAEGVHMQCEGFLSKPEWDFTSTPTENYPLLMHYHPLVIYRHQVLKQADVVLAQLLLPDRFTAAEKARNLAYYEPRTTHDSTLSACIYSIANAEVGDRQRAYATFEETYRMDLENHHGNTHYGLHMACMAGSWMAITYGFAGLRFSAGKMSFDPFVPDGWRDYSFNLIIQGQVLAVTVTAMAVTYMYSGDGPLEIMHRGKHIELAAHTEKALP